MIGRRALLRMWISTPLGIWLRPRGAEASEAPLQADAALHYRRAVGLLANLTDKDKALIRECRRVPLDGAVDQLLRRLTPALTSFHQGAAIPECAWDEVVSSEALGRDRLDSRNREVEHLAILRARSHWKHGRIREALDDLFAVVKFGRHIGVGGVLMARVYQCAFENEAIAVIAENLPRLDAPKLDALTARIDALPSSGTWAETMNAESRFVMGIVGEKLEGLAAPITVETLVDLDFFPREQVEAILKQTRGDRGRLLGLVKDVRPRLMELAEVLSLPRGGYKPSLEAFGCRVEVVNPIAASVVNAAENMKYAVDRTEALWSMLRAAIVMIRGGKERWLM